MGFMVYGLGFRVKCLGFRIWGLGFMISGSGCNRGRIAAAGERLNPDLERGGFSIRLSGFTLEVKRQTRGVEQVD